MREHIQNIITTHKQYARGGFFLLFSNVITTFANLAIVYVFANHISQETYGTYKYVLSIAGLLSITTLQGMNTAVIQSVSRGFDRTVHLAFRKKIQFGFLGTLGGLCIAGYYLYRGNEELAILFLAASICTPFIYSAPIYRAYLNGKKAFTSITKYTLYYQACFSTLFIGTLLITQNIVHIIFVYFVGGSIIQGILYKLATRTIPDHTKSEGSAIGYGKHLSLMKGLGTATGSIKHIALWHLLGPAALPVFALALAPVEQVRPFITVTENLLMPKMSDSTWKTGSVWWFLRKTGPFVVLISIGVLFYILVAPKLYEIFFPKYLESIIYSQFLAIGLIFTALQIVLTTILKSKRLIKRMYVTNAAAIVCDIFLIVPSIYFFGIAGLVAATLITKLITTIVSFVLVFTHRTQNNHPVTS